MTLSAELAAQIVRLYHAEHWRIGTIATQLGIHHSTVRRVLAREVTGPLERAERGSILDPYVPFIVETLERYPTLSAVRLYEMVRERGFRGAPDYFRHRVRRYRPRRPAEAYLRLRTLPGEEGQVDWAHFDKLTIGNAERPLLAFVMVLSFSRYVFVRFYLGQAMPNFLRGHVDAFCFFGAVPRRLLYDNLKSAVLERRANAIRFNPTLLELAAHYRFEPRPVAPYRGNEKGRVERAIRYIRENFFVGRTFADLDDLNAQAFHWCRTHAAMRPCPDAPSQSVRERFELERPQLLALPPEPFPTLERVEVHIGKTPYARFDSNDYSLPHTHVRRTLTVLASLNIVRICEAGTVLAEHKRSFDKGQQIEEPAHIEALVAYKRAARQQRAIDRLHHGAPSAAALLERSAKRGSALGVLTRGLLALLDLHGPAALEAAVVQALQSPAPHLGTVRQLIDLQHHQSKQPPPVTVVLPDDHRVRNLTVRPHDLDAYQRLIHTHSENNDHDD